MTTANKILESVYKISQSIERDWKEEYFELNIDEEVAPVFESVNGDTRFGNIIICFIVLAFSKDSKMLEPHKDRIENKKKIMRKLAGLSAMADEFWISIVDNEHEKAFAFMQWYIEYQKDERWQIILSYQDYAAVAQQMARRGPEDAQEAISIGKMLEIAEGRIFRAKELRTEIQQEFMSMDKILSADGLRAMTKPENSNFMRYETYMAEKKLKERQANSG